MRHLDLASQTDRITYLSGERNYTYVHFRDARPFLCSRTLLFCLTYLPQFIRIHRGYAVNPRFITAFGPSPDPRSAQVKVNSNWLPVSRRHKQAIIEFLQTSNPERPIAGLPAQDSRTNDTAVRP